MSHANHEHRHTTRERTDFPLSMQSSPQGLRELRIARIREVEKSKNKQYRRKLSEGKELEKVENNERSLGRFNQHVQYTHEAIARGKRLHPNSGRNRDPKRFRPRDTTSIRRARVELFTHTIEIDHDFALDVSDELVAHI